MKTSMIVILYLCKRMADQILRYYIAYLHIRIFEYLQGTHIHTCIIIQNTWFEVFPFFHAMMHILKHMMIPRLSIFPSVWPSNFGKSFLWQVKRCSSKNLDVSQYSWKSFKPMVNKFWKHSKHKAILERRSSANTGIFEATYRRILLMMCMAD